MASPKQMAHEVRECEQAEAKVISKMLIAR